MAKIDIGLTITGINNSTSAVRGASSDVKQLGENAQATANRLKAIQVVIAGILIEKTQEWAKALVDAASASQAAEIRMASFAGGATNAKKVMADLTDSFSATPLSVENIGVAWTHMQTAINNNAQTTTTIKAIVNDVTAMGGKDENVDNLAASFQRLYARGFASSREYISILQQTGLTLGDLAKAAGTNAPLFAQRIQQGFVSAQSFTDDFVKASQARFGDYADMLKNTVAGAWGNVQNTIKEGFNGLGQNTSINANITAVLNTMADAIKAVMDSISQEDIDKFVNWISMSAPLAINLVVALGHIAEASINIGSAMAAVLGLIPPDALELGIIGYALFGRAGAAVFGMLGLIDEGIRGIGSTVDQWFVDHNFFSAYFSADKAKLSKSTLDAVSAAINGQAKQATGADAFEKSWNAKIAVIQANLKKMQATQVTGGAPGSPLSPAALAAMQQAQAMTAKLKDDLASGAGSINQMNLATASDALGGQIADLNKKQLDFNKSVDAAALAESKLKVHLPENVALIAQMVAQKKLFGQAVDAASQKLQDEYYAQTLIYNLQQKQTQMQQQYSALQLKIANDSSAIAQAFQGTQAGQAALDTLGKQVQLREQLNTLTQQQVTQQAALADFDRNPNLSAEDAQRKANLEATLATTKELTAATAQSLQGMTVQGQLAKQMWKELGGAIENDVSSGISGLITGTETLGDAMRSVFTDMIQLAVKYLLQLAETQLFAQAANATALASAGPTAAAMAALWGPAATAASIATLGAADITGVAAYQAAMATSIIPFANGGVPSLGSMSSSVLTGPTMFGVAGEAGDEAIMPLTRIGGKLGVKTTGQGGDIHVHLQAIDTQSGVQFLAKHGETLQAVLGKRKNLNQGGR